MLNVGDILDAYVVEAIKYNGIFNISFNTGHCIWKLHCKHVVYLFLDASMTTLDAESGKCKIDSYAL